MAGQIAKGREPPRSPLAGPFPEQSLPARTVPDRTDCILR